MTNEELLNKMSDANYLLNKDIKLDDDIADFMLREFKTSYWNLLEHLVGKIKLKTGDKYTYNGSILPEFMLVRVGGQGWILVDSNGELGEHSIQNDLEIKLALFRYFTKVEA